MEQSEELKLFDFVKIIQNKSKKGVMVNENFVAFVVMRAMSYNPYAILIANAINRSNVQLSDQQVFDFLYNAVPEKSFHPGTWGKHIVSPEIQAIQSIYGVNESVANQYFKLMTEEQANELKRICEQPSR